MAPASGSAHGTTEPTARNFDCVATPHWPAPTSQAAIEYVATIGSAICQLGEVELEERGVGDERGCDLGPRQRRLHVLGSCGPHDDGAALFMRRAERILFDRVEDECVLQLERPLQRDLGDAAS